MCFILSAEWLGDDDADAVERGADPLHCPGIDSKPFGDDPYTRPSRSRQGGDEEGGRRAYSRPPRRCGPHG
jgi:hypothetical protein